MRNYLLKWFLSALTPHSAEHKSSITCHLCTGESKCHISTTYLAYHLTENKLLLQALHRICQMFKTVFILIQCSHFCSFYI